MKESTKRLPQIDAVMQHDDSTVFANKLLDELLARYTLNIISSHTGICRRSLSYMRHNGIRSFPDQLALEVMATRKPLAE